MTALKPDSKELYAAIAAATSADDKLAVLKRAYPTVRDLNSQIRITCRSHSTGEYGEHCNKNTSVTAARYIRDPLCQSVKCSDCTPVAGSSRGGCPCK